MSVMQAAQQAQQQQQMMQALMRGGAPIPGVNMPGYGVQIINGQIFNPAAPENDVNQYREIVMRHRTSGHQTVAPYYLAIRRLQSGEFEELGERPEHLLPKGKQLELRRLRGDIPEEMVANFEYVPTGTMFNQPAAVTGDVAEPVAKPSKKAKPAAVVEPDEDEDDEDDEDEEVAEKPKSTSSEDDDDEDDDDEEEEKPKVAPKPQSSNKKSKSGRRK